MSSNINELRQAMHYFLLPKNGLIVYLREFLKEFLFFFTKIEIILSDLKDFQIEY